MSILIKGMEMPKGEDEHRLIIRANGQVIIDKKTYWEEAEAVHVPLHGDLIDRDALEASCFMGSSSFYTQSDIDYAPTIIPASEEGE